MHLTPYVSPVHLPGIYMEDVPAAANLERLESRVLVKPSPLELKEPLAADPFVAMVPDSYRQRMDVHNATVQEMLHQMGRR